MASYGKITLLNADGTARQSFHLQERNIRIGRLSTCQLRIQLPSVSKLHAEIELGDRLGRLTVHSANGVRSASKLFKQGEVMELESGAVFTIAGRSFQIQIAQQPLPVHLETPAPVRLIRTEETPAPAPAITSSPSARSLLAALVSPLWGTATPKATAQPEAQLGDLIDWSEDDKKRQNERAESPLLPGGYREEKEEEKAADESDSSDEEIERSLISPRQSLGGPEKATSPPPLPPPGKLPNGVNRRHSLREKVLIRSAVRTHVMQRSYSTGSLTEIMVASPTPLPRRSSLPSDEAETVVSQAVADEEEEEVPKDEVDEREYEQDLLEIVEQPAAVSDAAEELWNRSPSSSPEQDKQRPRSASASSSDSEPSPRAMRAARRASLTEQTIVTPVRPVRESTLSPSPEPLDRHIDSEVPLKGEAPVTPRMPLKPRKSALKTPPPPSPTDGDTLPSTLKRKLSVNWDETLERVKEIPHRLDIEHEPVEALPQRKRARTAGEETPEQPVASTSTLTPSMSRPTLIFVHEHPEFTIPTTPTRPPTSARRVIQNRVPHSAGRARRHTPSTDRTLPVPMTTGRIAQTPDRPPLRKPGRSVSPTKNGKNGEAKGPTLAELLKSPIPKLGSFHPAPATPKAAPAPTTPSKTPTAQTLMSRLESIKRPTATAPEINFVAAPETPLITFDTPAPEAQSEKGAATPNLAGLSRLFQQPKAAPKTPQLGGMRQLFALPSIAQFSPALDGVKELLQPPTPAPIPLTVEKSKAPPSRQTSTVAATPTPALTKPPSVSGLPVRAASRIDVKKPAIPIKAVPEPKRAIPLRKPPSKEVLATVQKPVTRSDSGSSISSAGSDRETRSRSGSKSTKATKTPVVRARARSNTEDDPSPSARGVKGKENSHDANGSAVARRSGSATKETATTSRVLRARKA